MPQQLKTRHFDVLVIGGGSAGVATALAAKKNGADTLLVEAGPTIGGELVSGLPIDGCLNSRGEWIVGGVIRELFDACDAAGGYVGPVCDWRLIWAVCVDPEIFKLVIVEQLAGHGVPVLLYTFAEDVVMEGNRVKGIVVVNKSGRMLLTADMIVDCSGDGDIAVLAGADFEHGGASGEFQPLTLVFRMGNVDYQAYIEFVRDHPEEFLLAENPVWDKTREEAAMAVYESGQPFAGLSADGPLLKNAIESGEMYPCTAIYAWPTSPQRQELGLNTTRIANVDATKTEKLSQALATLTEQVQTCIRFVQGNVPGFENAHLSGIAPRVGIRETRRIMGEYVLTGDDVMQGRKFENGIAKGGHHVDIHGSGTDQVRVPVKDGGSYDIPYGTLIPKGLENVLVAGRCFSSDRQAHGSARVMGQTMAMGQAAGTAAAMCVACNWPNVRDVPIEGLRETLMQQGAVLKGTH